ncbi:LacI family DNA-binding transcriptional regulator [Mesorhizobium sp. BH1-1-4]|uniref:LacI family DNA-binding transcriptional regulator n=1 Tax=Mesorhizobium sp. BH1-1-4 TaxID=2876662 RepID=UPI001CD070EA|nr:LacI family DNA-binding transcriptional regulator [Mesorhizobium sp. BH1-1-4]MBZ9992808.1 LacI family DNA-binding transcriptional regulator [Mesorhizobium sp. BH1-1-4]
MTEVALKQPHTPRITVKDLARQLGMSVSTVSRAFYEDAVIAPKTRARILARAAELGYQPNPLARGLITKSSRIVGIVVSDITNPFYPEVLTRLTGKLQALDLNVMLVVTEPKRSEDETLRVLLSYHPDVVIILATTLSSASSDACRKVGTPVVFFNRYDASQRSYAVTCDNELGGRTVADHLIDLGHRRLAYVAGLPNASTNVDRWKGFHARCLERGVQAPLSSVGQEFSYAAGYAAAHGFLSSDEPPTALFCANDILAIGAMDAARRDFGLSIPDRLSVVGFDDIAMASWPSHDLTTVGQPMELMVERTVDLTLSLSRNDASQPALQRIPGKLVERSTTRAIDGRQ